MTRKLLFAFGLALMPIALIANVATEAENVETQPQEAADRAFEKAEETVSVSKVFHPCEPFTGRIKGNKVRLRTQSSLEGSVVRETTIGEMFIVVGEEGDFFAVRPSKDTKGYVFRPYVLEDVVEAERVNVRLYPDTEAPLVGRLNAGDKVKAVVSAANPKWLEIELPENARFYIAKDFIEKAGPADLLTKLETKKHDATTQLNTTFSFARSELQKPFEDIDLNQITHRFDALIKDYSEFPEIVEKAKEASHVVEETFVQKKIAFLESKADRTTAAADIDSSQLKKLINMSKDLKSALETAEVASISAGQGAVKAEKKAVELTDKMLVWKPLEESFYQVWASTHDNLTVDDFYKEEELNATVLSGIVEPYSRPVKNRPGDFILRTENHPVAFLYSTKVNLQEMVGKKITVIATPRPNNNFAFPAFFVLSVE